MTLSLLSAILYAAWVRAHKKTDWYLGFEQQTPLNPALAFFTFIILYNNLIPISLIITLDIVKYVVVLWNADGCCFCC
jgi:phospholipid-transporting ATPase